MIKADIIRALKRVQVETGSLVCLGCGHEHNCATKGCAIIRNALAWLEEPDWIPSEERLPSDGFGEVLVTVSGKIGENITLDHALELATYAPGEGWILESWPEETNITVHAWQPLPEAFE